MGNCKVSAYIVKTGERNMKKEFKGMFCPIVTPFKADQSIDFDAFYKVIDYVIDNGIDGILMCGGTGEYHAMSLEEQKEVLKKGIAHVAGRVPVLAGCSQSTPKAAIELGNFAAECGADWAMYLPPYYQCTTEQGIIDYFKEIADNVKIGIVLYNIPASTNVEITPEMIEVLMKHPNIIGLKDTADFEHTCKVLTITRGTGFSVFQGMENCILPAYLTGADGGFAILMNLLPKQYSDMMRAVEAGDWAKAAKINIDMSKLYNMMEVEPFPGPVKCGMNLIGVPGGCVRKPLVEPSKELQEAMKAELKKFGYKL